ncbi:MAG: phenylacetate-CoA oxygenase subunit PaaI [Acidobacteria bacterium]|nr:phenylacetate-CoA oxygenase subunit PaaI [Acidobacteriota bacterium]MDW7985216.1 Phenylacetic acid catabolic protein [Acidobacteriota bacterium]
MSDPWVSMEDDVRSTLQALVHSLAENKKLLGRRYSEWAVGGPTLEAAIALSAMTQDELGHSRVLYGLLEELRGMPATGDADWTVEGWSLSVLTRPFETWAHLVVVTVLLDSALTTLVEAATTSVFPPLQRRTRKMVEEERYHDRYGFQWLERLARHPQVRRVMAEPALQVCTEAMAWFGPPGDLAPLRATGILNADADELRDRYCRRIRSALEALDLRLEAVVVPWDRWDPAWRRLPLDD